MSADRGCTRRTLLGRLPALCLAPTRLVPLGLASATSVSAISASVSGARAAAAESLWRRSDDAPLHIAAASSGLTFGSAGGSELFADAGYRELFLAQAALLTPENALKMDRLQPERGRFRFAEADRLIDWARAEGLRVHGHTLIWNDRTPPWLAQLSRPEVEDAFDRYLDRVVPHFAGRVVSWDVVNEPFYLGGDHPGTYRPGPWYAALGPEYIVRAFRRTAELDPSAKLVLNEAWTVRADPIGAAVRRSLLRLVDELQHRGVKLDAVGLQSHLNSRVAHDDAGYAEFLHQLAERDVAIRLSEFDVDGAAYPDSERDARVARRTSTFLRTALAVAAVDTVVSWGLSDRYSWLRDPAVMVARGETCLPRPLPYDEYLRRQPMGTAMADAFRTRPRRG